MTPLPPPQAPGLSAHPNPAHTFVAGFQQVHLVLQQVQQVHLVQPKLIILKDNWMLLVVEFEQTDPRYKIWLVCSKYKSKKK